MVCSGLKWDPIPVSGRPRERRLLGRKPARAVINGLAAIFLTFPLILVCGRRGSYKVVPGCADVFQDRSL